MIGKRYKNNKHQLRGFEIKQNFTITGDPFLSKDPKGVRKGAQEIQYISWRRERVRNPPKYSIVKFLPDTAW